MEIRGEDKAVLSLESAVEFIFNINEQRKQIQAVSPALWQRLPCIQNEQEVLRHFHAARLRTAFVTEPLP